MVDRVSASIEVGGMIGVADYSQLLALIAAEDLSVEWDGEAFAPEHRQEGQSLRLYAHEVAWGRFDALEAKCIELGLAFVRWSGGCSGQWGSERVIFTGKGETACYPVDESDTVMISRPALKQLGSIEAILAWFDAADFDIPPLVLAGDDGADDDTAADDDKAA
ncbi:hypothetical protein [Sphingobium sp. DC-2]|uniref:hypothetical protein n=1 Tax=Sphingobium sp. DC-2 TaxID=1303256 RepID=UPI0004C367DC|nr:hypothetical protein [Sphingobium sp. DC-2]